MKLFKLLKEKYKYLKPSKNKIISASILIIFSSLIGLTYGYLNGAAVSSMVNLNIKASIIYLLLYFIGQIVGNGIIKRQSRLVLNKVQLDMTNRMSYDVFRKCLKLPVKVYEEKKSGEMLNRITTDTQTISSLLYSLFDTGVDLFAALIVLFYVFFNSWIVGLEIVIYLIILCLISIKYMKAIKNNQTIINRESDDLVADVNQNILGIREIKCLGARRKVNANMKYIIDSLFDKKKDQLDLETRYSFLIKIMNSFLEVGVYVTCGLLIYFKLSDITFFVAMTWYVYRFMWVVENITNISTNYQKVVVALERIDEVLLNKISNDEVFGDVNLTSIEGNIKFENIDFKYEGETLLLNNFNIEINKNQKVAIIGKSGGGKSTLFNLLLRLFDPINGNIYIDDINVKNFTEDTLRNNVSIIRQDPFLFNKSFFTNFKIVNPDITIEEVREYCKAAYIDDYIMSLPKNYNTIIGEGGVNLSGGQKQRLSIARSLAKKSKIILFDEATSALDNESQEYIKSTINKLSKNHTIIIIAHRLSTIEDADIIYLIDKGQVVASGKHDELLKNNKQYKQLYSPETFDLNI